VVAVRDFDLRLSGRCAR